MENDSQRAFLLLSFFFFVCVCLCLVFLPLTFFVFFFFFFGGGGGGRGWLIKGHTQDTITNTARAGCYPRSTSNLE